MFILASISLINVLFRSRSLFPIESDKYEFGLTVVPLAAHRVD